MAFSEIKLNKRVVSLHKCCVDPAFGSQTVLVADAWDYVSLWLRRSHCKDAAFYWDQAKHFSDASAQLPNTSSPLTTYYCFLNAVKALLCVRNMQIADAHGVSGTAVHPHTALLNEQVTFQQSGCLAGLCQHLGEPCGGHSYTLKDLLYNLPYVHRAYNLTFTSRSELYVPVSSPRFVRKNRSTEAWFCADITDSKYTSQHTLKKLADEFELDEGVKESCTVRMKRRFKWDSSDRDASLARLKTYHQRLRRSAQYIHGPNRLWYLKRGPGPDGLVERSTLTIAYAAMHRLSELARYQPMLLARHFESQSNWLLSEFIAVSRTHFIDEISSEITGHEFMLSGWRSVR